MANLDLLAWAIILVNLGANVLALSSNKSVLHSWKRWETLRQSVQDILGLVTSKKQRRAWDVAYGVGIVNGINGWRSFDLDKCLSFVPVETLLDALGLPSGYPWIVKTGSGKGWHIWVTCLESLPDGVLISKSDKDSGVFWGLPRQPDTFDHVELRWQNCMTVAPLSLHPSSQRYSFRGDTPTSAPAKVSADQVIKAFLALAVPGRPEALKKSPTGQVHPAPSFTPDQASVINPAVVEALAGYFRSLNYRQDGDWLNGQCPNAAAHSHGDRTPSFGFNMVTGRSKCFRCGSFLVKTLCEYANIDYQKLGGLFDPQARSSLEYLSRGKLTQTALAPIQPPRNVPLVQAQAVLENALHDYLKMKGKAKGIRINAPPGVGKTHSAWQEAQRLAEQGKKVAVFIWHRLDDVSGPAFVRQFGVDPGLCFFYEGREAETNSKGYCAQKDLANSLASKGYNTKETVCLHCPISEQCKMTGYLSQGKAARTRPILVARHGHLRVDEIFKGRHTIIIDECPLEVITEPLQYLAQDLRPRKTSIVVIPDDLNQQKLVQQQHQVNRIYQALSTVLTNQPAVPLGGYADKKHLLLGGRPVFEHLIAALQGDESVFEALDKEGINQAKTIWMAEAMSAPTNSSPLLRWLKCEYDTFYKAGAERWNSRIIVEGRRLLLYEMLPIKLHTSAKLIILDATGDPERYRKAFSAGGKRNFDIVTIDIPVEKRAYVTVITGSEQTRASMKPKASCVKHTIETIDGQQFEFPIDFQARAHRPVEWAKDFILRIADKHGTPLVVTYKSLAEQLQSWGKEVDLPAHMFTWFGANRGKNDWKEVEAAVVIGTPRVPEMEALKLAQAWHTSDPKPLSFEKVDSVLLHYPGYVDPVDGQGRAWASRGYTDPRIQAMIDHDIRAELWQSAGRIRPDTSDSPRHLYIVTAYPCTPYVDTIIDHRQWSLEDLIAQSTLRPASAPITISELVKEFARQPGTTKQRQADKYSERTIRDACPRVWARLQKEGLGRVLTDYLAPGATGRPTTAFMSAASPLFAPTSMRKEIAYLRKT